jgi:hypothetical protein
MTQLIGGVSSPGRRDNHSLGGALVRRYRRYSAIFPGPISITTDKFRRRQQTGLRTSAIYFRT